MATYSSAMEFRAKGQRFATLFLAIGLVVVAFTSCNTAKNTASTRRYQAFITKYNIQYNGDKHYRETLQDMERAYEDNFDNLLPVHPSFVRGNTDFPQPQGDFMRSVEKAQKAIQLHSITRPPKGRARTAAEREWKSRTEYNPYLHNSWMLMGKALYMHGEYKKASAVFAYIAAHFKWLPSTIAEARTWQAACYCAMNDLYLAEILLASVNVNNLATKQSLLQYYTTQATLVIQWGTFESALTWIHKAIPLSKGKQKQRLLYLAAQISEKTGDYKSARSLYAKVAKNMNIDVRTKQSANDAVARLRNAENQINTTAHPLDSLIANIPADSVLFLQQQKATTDSLYTLAFNSYLNDDLTRVHNIVDEIGLLYPSNPEMPRFMLLNALAYAVKGENEEFKTNIDSLLRMEKLRPEMRTLASQWMQRAERGDTVVASEIRPAMTITAKYNFPDELALENINDVAMLDSLQNGTLPTLDEMPDGKCRIVIEFKAAEINANRLLYEIADFNFDTFMAREFDLAIDNSFPIARIIVSGFNNRLEASHYKNLLMQSEIIASPPVEVTIEMENQ